MQVKTQKTDVYIALQLGYDEVKASRVKMPAKGHAQKANSSPKRFVRSGVWAKRIRRDTPQAI
jgi:large subunit ribosomal protein L3